MARLTDYERERRVAYERLGLDALRAVLERLGHPERAYPVLHIAGSKGKGTTAAFADAMLAAAGIETGLFTSPHVVTLEERIRTGGQMISTAALGRTFLAVEPALAAPGGPAASGGVGASADAGIEGIEAPEGGPLRLTFFELITALALRHFHSAGAGAVILETGLGGRLDATNVVEQPAATGITGIEREHVRILGDTLTLIAREKAGILKPGVPCVLGPMPSEARAAIRAVAEERGAPLVEAPDAVRAHSIEIGPSGTRAVLEVPGRAPLRVALGLRGRPMAWNAALALALVDLGCARAGLARLDDDVAARGLAAARLPARFETRSVGGIEVVLDAAHTPAAAAALAETWRAVYGDRQAILLAGVLADKDLAAVLAPLGPIARFVVASPCGSPRERAPRAVARAARLLGLRARAEPTPEAALETALRAARKRDLPVLVAGSIYLAGLVSRMIGG